MISRNVEQIVGEALELVHEQVLEHALCFALCLARLLELF